MARHRGGGREVSRPHDDSLALPLRAGPAALLALAGVLDLPASPQASGAYRLKWVEGQPPERLRFCLQIGHKQLKFHLKSVESPGAFIRTDHLSICYEGARCGPRVERLLRGVGKRLADHTLEDLFRMLSDDPLTTALADPSSSVDPSAGSAPSPDTDGPDGARAWWRFFAQKDLSHDVADPLWEDDKVCCIEYGDAECFFSHSHPDPHKWTFFNDPRLPLPSCAAAGGLPPLSFVLAELDEGDVVMGTDALKDALVQSVKNKSGEAELFVMNHLCTPVVIGEDLEGLARRCAAVGGRPVLESSRQSKTQGNLLGRVLRMLRSEPQFCAAVARPAAVNLFGFGKRFRDEELVPWLQALGLEVNETILPEVKLSSLRRITVAQHNVICTPNDHTAEVVQELGDLPRNWIQVPAAYGLARTRACLSQIAQATGRREAGAEQLEQRWSAMRPAWDALVEQARGLRLAFVVAADTLALLDSSQGLQVPVLEVLAEIGFGVDLLCYAPREPLLLDSIPVAWSKACDLRSHCFRTTQQLAELLRQGSFQAVYTDFAFDWRVARFCIPGEP